MWYFSIIFIYIWSATAAYKSSHFMEGRTAIVHLFEWKYKDIADECEKFLSPMGYGGVQVSPISENLILETRPWFERYQPISYKIITRSGNEDDFKNMVKRCNKVGVRIYVDIVLNHMTYNQSPALGAGGSTAIPEKKIYPSVPYTAEHFHETCLLLNYNNPVEIRNCELNNLHDLDHSKEHVRKVIKEYLDKLLEFGVAGFRVDGAKHMWPEDLQAIFSSLRNLSEENGFDPDSQPFLYQEIIDVGASAVRKEDYLDIGMVIEPMYGIVLGDMFLGKDKLQRLSTWGASLEWKIISSKDAIAMIDNHDNQRGYGIGGRSILTHRYAREYRMAVAFMLAHPYGIPCLMSSYNVTHNNAGPPTEKNDEIRSRRIYSNGSCDADWICEHRWFAIRNMIHFRNLAKGEKLQNWWSNGNDQIAFSRGSRCFVVFNIEKHAPLRETLMTGLSAGIYCDVISGSVENGRCTGKSIEVRMDGTAFVEMLNSEPDGVLAIHIEVSVCFRSTGNVRNADTVSILEKELLSVSRS